MFLLLNYFLKFCIWKFSPFHWGGSSLMTFNYHAISIIVIVASLLIFSSGSAPVSAAVVEDMRAETAELILALCTSVFRCIFDIVCSCVLKMILLLYQVRHGLEKCCIRYVTSMPVKKYWQSLKEKLSVYLVTNWLKTVLW